MEKPTPPKPPTRPKPPLPPASRNVEPSKTAVPTPTNSIPELVELIDKFGITLGEQPHFVIVGKYKSKAIGSVMGIIAAANNEFHAHLLKREISKNGVVTIERSEYHPDGCTFSIQAYYKKIREMKSNNA